MLRYHMVVVSSDNRLKREIKRVTAATAATADYIDDVAKMPGGDIDLAIIDARTDDPPLVLLQTVPPEATLTYVLAEERLIEKLELLGDPRATSLMCHGDRFDEDEFIASATKALRGEVFGLQKYFPWGVTTYSMVVRSYKQKDAAIGHLIEYIRLAGVRRSVGDRIQLVCDELMMNALYHAPVDEDGNELYATKTQRDMAQLEGLEPIEVQYGCSGRFFGISVRDGFGSLTRDRMMRYLRRAQSGTADIEDKATGAGLGLITVLRSVSKLVFNLEPGNSTEVIALFDLDLIAQRKWGARSLHLFAVEPEPEDDAELEEDATESMTVTPETMPHDIEVRSSGAGTWALVAILLAVLSALVTAYFMR